MGDEHRMGQVADLADLQMIRRRTVVTGMVSEYHHAT